MTVVTSRFSRAWVHRPEDRVHRRPVGFQNTTPAGRAPRQRHPRRPGFRSRSPHRSGSTSRVRAAPAVAAVSGTLGWTVLQPRSRFPASVHRPHRRPETAVSAPVGLSCWTGPVPRRRLLCPRVRCRQPAPPKLLRHPGGLVSTWTLSTLRHQITRLTGIGEERHRRRRSPARIRCLVPLELSYHGPPRRNTGSGRPAGIPAPRSSRVGNVSAIPTGSGCLGDSCTLRQPCTRGWRPGRASSNAGSPAAQQPRRPRRSCRSGTGGPADGRRSGPVRARPPSRPGHIARAGSASRPVPVDAAPRPRIASIASVADVRRV